MAICSCCGQEFDLDEVRSSIDEEYGEGMYDNSYFDGRVCCEDCAFDEIGSAVGTGKEMKELMGSSWYDD